LDGINKQIAQNVQDLPAAIDANARTGTGEAVQGKAAVDALLENTIVSSAAPVQTLSVENVDGPATAVVASTVATATTKAATGKKNGKNNASTSVVAAAEATTTATKAAKGNKDNNNNNNNKRSLGSGMRWAKRMVI